MAKGLQDVIFIIGKFFSSMNKFRNGGTDPSDSLAAGTIFLKKYIEDFECPIIKFWLS